MKALQTLMKRSTNCFFFVDSRPVGRMSCGGGRGAWAALCLIGWLWGQCGEFGCFISQFGENKQSNLSEQERNQRQKSSLICFLKPHIFVPFCFSLTLSYRKTNEESCTDFTSVCLCFFGPLAVAELLLIEISWYLLWESQDLFCHMHNNYIEALIANEILISPTQCSKNIKNVKSWKKGFLRWNVNSMSDTVTRVHVW